MSALFDQGEFIPLLHDYGPKLPLSQYRHTKRTWAVSRHLDCTFGHGQQCRSNFGTERSIVQVFYAFILDCNWMLDQ